MNFNQLTKALEFQTEKGYGWEMINGYPIILENLESNEALVKIFCKVVLETESGDAIVTMLDNLCENGYIVENGINDISVELVIDMDMDIDDIKQLFNDITLELKKNVVRTVCNVCQEPEIVQLCKYENAVVPVCETCIHILDKVHLTEEKNKNGLIRGILFSFIGASLGAGIMLLLALFGFPYPSLAGLFVLFLAAFGYQISKSKSDKLATLIVIGIGLFVLVGAAFAVNDIYLMKVSGLGKREILFKTFHLAFVDSFSSFQFLINLAVSVVLFFTFGFSKAREIGRAAKLNSNFKRL